VKNSNLNNEYLGDEIDLRKLLRIILNSKKLIIILTLAFSLLAFIYTTQKEPVYQSNVILEVGSYRLTDGEEKIIEPVLSLIKKLKVELIYKKQLQFAALELNIRKLNFKSIEDKLLEISYTSPSPEFNEIIINEAITFSQESHAEIITKIVNSLDTELELFKNSIKNKQEVKKLATIQSIKAINNKIPTLEVKIKYLLKLIPEEENNLIMLESDNSALLLRATTSPSLQQIIYSYNEQVVILKNQIQDLQQAKEDYEIKVKSIEEGEFVSTELFELSQEKEVLEMQIKSINDHTNLTKPIHELETSEIETNTLSMILIGTILGFIFSIFIVFFRQAFLKEQN